MTKEKLKSLIDVNRTIDELEGVIRELEYGNNISIKGSYWTANISNADFKKLILKTLKDIYAECNKIIEEA